MADNGGLDIPMPDAEPRPSPDSSEADGDSSSENEAVVPMVVARTRRANAGNRMGQLLRLAGEEDNQNVEAYGEIFQEAADDVEFQADDDQDGDVNMETSSEEDEDEGGQDELQGEKELRAAERKGAGHKRKRALLLDSAMKRATARQIPHTVIPSPGSVTGSASGSVATRPRKKSERVSWLPEEEEGPKRASSRHLSVQNKEMVHSRLKEKEKHRLRTVAIMKAAEMRKEARKPKVLTQAQRLQEAAATEKANSKSLHKWETAEKKREEEQAARLAALKNRKLEGPIVSYWSGPSLWVNGKLRGTGKAVLVEEVGKDGTFKNDTVEEAPATETPVKAPSEEKTELVADTTATSATPNPAPTPGVEIPSTAAPLPISNGTITAPPSGTETPSAAASLPITNGFSQPASPPVAQPVSQPVSEPVQPVSEPVQPVSEPVQSVSEPVQSVSEPVQSVSEPAQPVPEPVQPVSQPAAPETPNPELNITTNGTIPEVVQLPETVETTPSINGPPLPTTSVPPQDPPSFIDELHAYANLPLETQQSTIPPVPQTTAPAVPKKQTREVAARTLIQLRDFSPEIKPRDKDAYMHHLCDWPSTPPKKLVPAKKTLCVITGQAARYCDPGTGMAYMDSCALKGIRRLMGGGSRWSTLLGGYVGPRYGETINKAVVFGRPAVGVPEGFWKKKVPPVTAVEAKVEGS